MQILERAESPTTLSFPVLLHNHCGAATTEPTPASEMPERERRPASRARAQVPAFAPVRFFRRFNRRTDGGGRGPWKSGPDRSFQSRGVKALVELVHAKT